MFIDVINVKRSLVDLDRILKKSRNNAGEVTPEIVEAFLHLSNHIGHMKTIVKWIGAIKDKEKRLAFKDVVISMVERRVQADSVMEKLRALAVEGGYEEEFDEANNKTKWFGKEVCQRDVVESYDWFEKGKKELQPPILSGSRKHLHYNNIDYISFGGHKFNVLSCGFTPDAEINLLGTDEVCLRGVEAMPFKFPFSDCGVIGLHYVDLDGVENIEFKDKAEVTFGNVKNIKDIDFSKCYTLTLSNCDLCNVKELKFDNAWKVEINGCNNLPEVLDFSNVDNVDLSNTDLSGVKEIKFKDGARVVFDYATNFPEYLDVSKCASATFNLADMSGVKKLKIKDEQKLERLKAFPQNIDCAECETFLSIGFADLTKVREISNVKGINLYLSDSYNTSEVADFSDFEKVHMQFTAFAKREDGVQNDYVGIEAKDYVKIKAKELVINECYKFPKVLDLSECDSVTIDKSHLGDIENIIFKEGADIFIWGCYGMPKNIDVSMCGNVNFSSCRMSKVEEIKFRDEAQCRMAFEHIDDFKGKKVIVNTGNLQKVVALNSSLEL